MRRIRRRCDPSQFNCAIRVGDWKLVAKENQPWELYDVAAEQSERVQQLAAKWDDWAKRTNVLPLGTWKAKAAPK